MACDHNIILANNVHVKVSKWVKIEATLSKLDNIKLPIIVYIMPELSQELILVTKFLRENNFEMNLTNNIVKIAGVEIKLDTNNLWKLSPPGQLLEKIDHLNVMSERIEKLINNYKTTTPELGLITNVEMSIELEDDQPINLKPYSFPYQSLNSIKQEIDRLLKLDIIRKSTSKYASPAFPILKKNGKTRLVVDYRRLNAKTIKCAFPFPDLFQELRSLSECKVFSQLDLNMGYHQIPIKESDKGKTAFVITGGHYEYNRVPFGLTNAPKIFQRVMKDMLSKFDNVKVFLDDILIFTETLEKHENILERLLEVFKINNVSVNFEKATFVNQK